MNWVGTLKRRTSSSWPPNKTTFKVSNATSQFSFWVLSIIDSLYFTHFLGLLWSRVLFFLFHFCFLLSPSYFGPICFPGKSSKEKPTILPFHICCIDAIFFLCIFSATKQVGWQCFFFFGMFCFVDWGPFFIQGCFVLWASLLPSKGMFYFPVNCPNYPLKIPPS